MGLVSFLLQTWLPSNDYRGPHFCSSLQVGTLLSLVAHSTIIPDFTKGAGVTEIEHRFNLVGGGS